VTNQLGLFGLARRQDATLMLAQHHRDGDAARKGIQKGYRDSSAHP
jgi:hypothetical protein